MRDIKESNPELIYLYNKKELKKTWKQIIVTN